MTKTTDFTEFPPHLSCMTAHLRVHIGENGWNSTLAQWGDKENPAKSFRIYTRAAVDDADTADKWDTRQNYLAFSDASGKCDVLEVEVGLKNHNPAWTSMRVGVPAARIGKGRTLDIIVRFTGISLALYVDGVLVDENWPVGKIPSGAVLEATEKEFDCKTELLEVLPRALSEKEIEERCGGASLVEKRTLEILGAENEQMQYWTPRGHNQWVGDVMFGDTWSFDKDKLHLFYLIDRRHHSSKFGAGGHLFAHMSSTDLIHWEHHPVSIELDAWDSLATGRPFIHDGKLTLGYGMHTSRVFPNQDTLTLRENGDKTFTPRPFPSTGPLPVGEPDAGKYPMGSTFAESTDGITFKKSNLLIHECQNPSILRDESGKGYLMLAGYGRTGLWGSADLMRWYLKDPDIIPIGKLSPVDNTSECQCLFGWNGWHYIIGGRTGFWMSRNQAGPFWEGRDGKNTGVVKPRWDLNEGLWVPMVAEFKNNRRILAGFLTGPGFGWAGHLVFRELIQFPDGSLGLKWPDEMRLPIRKKMTPEIHVGGKAIWGNSVSIDSDSGKWAEIRGMPASIHLSLRITPEKKTTHIAIAGLDEFGKGGALSILPKRSQAQWNSAQSDELPQVVPTLEDLLALEKGGTEGGNSHTHYNGCDFAITSVEGLASPFDLELIFIYDAKSMSTIIDACICGCRTMITRRKGLVLKTLRFMADGPVQFDKISIGQL
jgi:hypothetical protein